ncbi:MAG: hypothetical protein K2W85_01640, partial [Phycisphaerales bacterium]|nr:hypothetical protein [Phycisphaerales bacterium]
MPFLKHPANHIFEFTLESLQAWMAERGMPKFRAEQLLDWVYVKGVCDPAKMTNLSKRDRDLLSDPQEGITFLSGSIVSHQAATDGVQKLLIEWNDYSAQAATKPDSSIALRVMGS